MAEDYEILNYDISDFIKRNKKPNIYVLGNDVLYNLCKNNLLHTDDRAIVSKIWLIGRSYAAALERRKNAGELKVDDFYVDIALPAMKKNAKDLDARILRIQDNQMDIPLILETHKLLMDTFKGITELNKRSLASKYLHFHCPKAFFIYDSRSTQQINKYIKRKSKFNLSEPTHDIEYSKFYNKALYLTNDIKKKYGLKEFSPRDLDNLLLFNDDKFYNYNKK